MSRPLLLTTTTTGLDRSEVRAFLASFLRRARELAGGRSMVPLAPEKIREELSWLGGGARPAVVPGPDPAEGAS